MLYLGQPYSSPDKAIMSFRYRAALGICAELVKKGEFVFSPIVHWHNVAASHYLPTGHEFWLNLDLHFLERCDGLLVAKLPGWENSIGLAREMDFAVGHSIPITYWEMQE
jgi:hypothetical protein